MIAVDTNLLVYAHRRDSPWHDKAMIALAGLSEGPRLWAIPWPVVYEFIGIVTHPRIYDPPSALGAALDQLASWRESPTVRFLGETPEIWPLCERSLLASRASGPRVHDARIAVLCVHHGVEELWTADRDFSRFPGLKVRNPLVS